MLDVSSAVAAEPTLTHLHPIAGSPGAKVEVTASGKFEPWPPQVWVDAPGIVFTPGKKSGKFQVAVAADVAPGPHLVRLFNDRGASAPRFFIVAPQPDVAEVEPNDLVTAPQKIATLPATIGGRLAKAGDVDGFAVALRRGDTLAAWLEAYVLGSTFDGLLRVVDERGTLLGFAHDGRALDPSLRWTAPRDGTFLVQVLGFVYPATASVNLTGGDGCVYRLHLSTTPEKPEPLTEREPNDTRAAALAIEIPGSVTGAITREGDEDRFAFTAVKQRSYTVQVVAARDGSPLDAWLKIENADGKELARNDDTGASRDPRLTWTAPGDGRFHVALGELTRRGGPDHRYRLTIEETAPAITATAAQHAVTIAAGKATDVKMALARSGGHQAPLRLAARNLPPGVTADEIDVHARDGEATLKLTAAADAPRASQPFSIVLRDPAGSAEFPAHYSLITTGEDNGVPQGYTDLLIPATEQLWITVQPAPETAGSVQ